MLTIVYSRVSTTEQTTTNQLLEIEHAGYRPDLVFADEGVSGSTQAFARPEFRSLIATVEKAQEPVRVVVTKLDRLGRDTIDILNSVEKLRSFSVQIIVLQLGTLDLSSSAGKLTLNVLSAVAEMERDLIRERTQAGLARAKASGKTLGRPRKLSSEDRDEIVAELKQGQTVSALARHKNVSRATILNALKKASESI